MVQLDSDMAVFQNMDELMALELDPASSEGKGHRVFAGSHACVCNPLKKPHYPKEWYAQIRTAKTIAEGKQDTRELRFYISA